MNFHDRLIEFTNKQNSLLCIGLDPDIRRIPECIKSHPQPLLKFCSEIIQSTKHVAAAYKINFAFFEAEGSRGWAQLENLVDCVPANILKIADAKRADIGNTSLKYAEAILEKLTFDAVTVNPYLGHDSIAPFLQWPEKGAFILCLTSNPGAKDFQYFSDGSKTLFLRVLETVQSWNSQNNCGLVVGATHGNELKKVRNAAQDLPFLIPGLGVQGGDLVEAVKQGTNKSGQLALFNASRSIIFKSSGSDFAEAAQRESEFFKDEINRIRSKKI